MGLLDAPALGLIASQRLIEFEGWSVISTNPCKPSTKAASGLFGQSSRVEVVPALATRALKIGFVNWTTGGTGETPNTNPIRIRASLQPEGASINETLGDPSVLFTFGGADTLILGRGKFSMSDVLHFGNPSGQRFFILTYADAIMPAAPSALTGVTFNTGSGGLFASGNVYGVSWTQVFPGGIESAAAPIASVTCGSTGNNIVVPSPSNPNNGSIGYRLWLTPNGGSTPCYDTSLGIMAYGQGATITGSILAISQQNVEQVDPSGSLYLPLGNSTLGGTAAGASNNGEANVSGSSSFGDRTGDGHVISSAGTLSSFIVAPAIVQGKSGSQVLRSCGIIGDSIAFAIADYGFGGVLGGYMKRAIMGQTAAAAYNAAIVPTMGHVWVPQGAETALQFSGPAGVKRSQVASKCTSIWCNYGTNDIPLGVAPLIGSIQIIAARFTSQGKPFIQNDILPKATSTDGWATVTNQVWGVNGTVGEATRRAFNNWLTSSTGAVAVSGEAPFRAQAANPGPTYNPFSGGDAATHNFYTAQAFAQGTESVTVNGVAKVVTTDYTYLFPQTINGTAYASGVAFTSAPGNGLAVLISYTKIPCYTILCGSLAKYLPIAIAVEVNASGVPTLNGGWWTTSGSIQVGPKTLTGTSSTTITDSGQTWTQDQWRGFQVLIVTDSVTPAAVGQVLGIASNTPTVLNMGAAWTTTPSTSATYQIFKCYTQDGTHPTTQGHMLIAPQAITAGILSFVS